MREVVDDLEAQQAELSQLLDGLDEDGWAKPSRCEGWSVADVALHLAQTNEMATASATGRYRQVLAELTKDLPPAVDVDAGADAMVARDRVGALPEILLARWHESADDVVSAFRTVDPGARVEWVAGTLTARTLAATRLAETWIHTNDAFAAAFGGKTPEPTERLWHVARLAWRTVPYAFQRAGRILQGPVAFHLVGPTGEAWRFEPDEPAATTVRGSGAELCWVASRRIPATETGLDATGPDGDEVLELVRTWA